MTRSGNGVGGGLVPGELHVADSRMPGVSESVETVERKLRRLISRYVTLQRECEADFRKSRVVLTRSRALQSKFDMVRKGDPVRPVPSPTAVWANGLLYGVQPLIDEHAGQHQQQHSEPAPKTQTGTVVD